METFEEKLKRVTSEIVEIVEYNPDWPEMFEREKEHLMADLPNELIIRIEHFGSTAVAGLCAKPVIDMLIEISNVELGRKIIPEILEPQGYDCFWRPTGGDDIPPWYTWCIGRNEVGKRTHHLHFVEAGTKEKELRFRDILRANPSVANEYGKLKLQLAEKHMSDRITYTKAKGDFIRQVLRGEK